MYMLWTRKSSGNPQMAYINGYKEDVPSLSVSFNITVTC